MIGRVVRRSVEKIEDSIVPEAGDYALTCPEA